MKTSNALVIQLTTNNNFTKSWRTSSSMLDVLGITREDIQLFAKVLSKNYVEKAKSTEQIFKNFCTTTVATKDIDVLLKNKKIWDRIVPQYQCDTTKNEYFTKAEIRLI